MKDKESNNFTDLTEAKINVFEELLKQRYFYRHKRPWHRPSLRRIVYQLLTLTLAGWLLYSLINPRPSNSVSYPQLKDYIEKNEVDSVTITDDEIRINHKVKGTLKAKISASEWSSVLPELISHNVRIAIPERKNSVSSYIYLIPILFLLLAFLLRRAGADFIHIVITLISRQRKIGTYPSGFSASSKLINSRQRRVTYKDIVVPNHVWEAVTNLIDFLKEQPKYKKLGAQMPMGCLFAGPPGVGKSLMARAVAGEANVPFFSLNGSDFSGAYLGTGPARLQDLIDQCNKNAPCIAFIDNIDVIAKSRALWADPLTLDSEMTLVKLTAHLDRLDPDMGVIFFAATNRLDLIDEALIRPGRLKPILFSYPTTEESEQIVKIHVRKIPLDEDVNMSELALRFHELFPLCTGAIIEEVVNHAAGMAAARQKKLVDMQLLFAAMEDLKQLSDEKRRL
ncbi:MAG: ATP-dependent metallopeptidase FtsH/Yme1/Tma family protein [Chitinophagaceae bacterium]